MIVPWAITNISRVVSSGEGDTHDPLHHKTHKWMKDIWVPKLRPKMKKNLNSAPRVQMQWLSEIRNQIRLCSSNNNFFPSNEWNYYATRNDLIEKYSWEANAINSHSFVAPIWQMTDAPPNRSCDSRFIRFLPFARKSNCIDGDRVVCAAHQINVFIYAWSHGRRLNIYLLIFFFANFGTISHFGNAIKVFYNKIMGGSRAAYVRGYEQQIIKSRKHFRSIANQLNVSESEKNEFS